MINQWYAQHSDGVRVGRVFTAKSEEWVLLTFEKQRGISEAKRKVAEFPEIRT